MVAQEPLVFADTIKANILFGTRRSDVTQVRAGALGCVPAHCVRASGWGRGA
jgi:ABC-type transport system involved in cytochrome bd biosynthesis fused ATPase/permease subunit